MKNLIKIVFTFFIFSLNTIQAQWHQIGQLEGQEVSSRAGWSVSMNSDGTVIAYGEVTNSNNGINAGQVKIYKKTNDNWNQIGQTLQGLHIEGYFGDAVSLNAEGNIVAVGAPYVGDNGVNSGQVRVYENVDGNWEQMGQNINGESAFNNSGRSISLNASGTILAIGSHYNSNNGNQTGHVRVFEFINGAWVQLGLDIYGETQFSEFGWSVSLSDDGVIVAIGTKYNQGLVHVYQYQNGSWVQMGENIEGEAENDSSGYSVSINSNGSIVAIGAINNGANGSLAGHVRVYEYNNEAWQQLGGDIDGEEGDSFGYSVCISDDGLTVASSALNGDGLELGSGLVRIYSLNNGTWTQLGGNIEGEVYAENFGRSVSINSDATSVVVGAPNSGENSSSYGNVRIFGSESLGIIENSKKEQLVYPNPTNNLINIKTNTAISAYSIYDVTGKLIISKEDLENKSSLRINMSNFENGIYIIKLKGDKQVFETKIIKQ